MVLGEVLSEHRLLLLNEVNTLLLCHSLDHVILQVWKSVMKLKSSQVWK